MKTKYLLIGAFALVTLVACKREMVYNPDYDPETETVKTQFVFNVSTASNETKQVASETQATPTASFLGIDHAWVFAYKQGSGSTYPGGKILSSDANADADFNLDNLLAAGDLSQQTALAQTDHPSHRVTEMQLPIYTNTLLFYGRGKPGAIAQNDPWSLYDHYGHMDAYTVSKTAGSADFRLGKRLSDGPNETVGTKMSQFQNVEKLLAGIITIIMNSNLVESGSRKTVSAATKPSTFEVDDEEMAALMKPYAFALSANQTDENAVDYYPSIKWSDYVRPVSFPEKS